MISTVARKQVLDQLDDAQVAALDGLADAAEDSRSELIRRAIDLYVAAAREGIEDLRYAEAYAKAPEDIEELAGLRAIAAWPEG
jgi:predicted transcriptional regulator